MDDWQQRRHDRRATAFVYNMVGLLVVAAIAIIVWASSR